MNSHKNRSKIRQRSRDPLERKMDQWFETGRQFVDGVSGTRPGQRRSAKFSKPIGKRIDHMGRWVEDKLDWFFEDEDDWLEPWEAEQRETRINSSNNKRPLEAISLRGSKAIAPAISQNNISNELEEDNWPDESSFRVNRWERQQFTSNEQESNNKQYREISSSTSRRPLPRSSRRRN